MRQIDRNIVAADSDGGRIDMLLGVTPDGGLKTFAMRHQDIGTITAVVSDDDIDEMIAELQALRAEA